MTDSDAQDPAAGFAALMSGAADAAAGEQEQAPWGWTTDRETGERRPKKAPGRGFRKPPNVEELKAAQDPAAPGAAGAAAAEEDRAPGKPRGKRRRGGAAGPAAADGKADGFAQYRPGVIAKGMTTLYQRAGRIMRVMDEDIGAAVIESAADCGEAWDELARTNPRVRAALMKALRGGAWTQLLMAHAPVAMAVFMKDRIRRHVPFLKLAEALLDEQPAGHDGMTTEDLQAMMAMTEGMMAQMGLRVPPRRPGPGPAAAGPVPA